MSGVLMAILPCLAYTGTEDPQSILDANSIKATGVQSVVLLCFNYQPE